MPLWGEEGLVATSAIQYSVAKAWSKELLGTRGQLIRSRGRHELQDLGRDSKVVWNAMMEWTMDNRSFPLTEPTGQME